MIVTPSAWHALAARGTGAALDTQFVLAVNGPDVERATPRWSASLGRLPNNYTSPDRIDSAPA